MAQKKALVGESHYAEFEILNDFLTNRGFKVHWVKNGRDAVAQFGQFAPDLVILDALIPGLAGLKVVQAIRKQEEEGGSRARVILLSTVYKQFKDKYDSRKDQVGVDAYSEKPVDVAALEKLINDMIGSSASEAGGTAEPTVVEQIPVAQEGKRKVGPSGSFETTSFPKVLYFLRKFKRTGALEVQHELINKVIYVQSGKLAFVSSNQSSESLGRYMVQTGILSVSDYNSSLEQMLKTGQEQGRVLLDMGVVTPHQLFEALRGHVLEKILSIFAWETGKFSLRSGRLKLDSTLTVELEMLDVIYEGIKRFYPLSRLETYFNEYKNQRILKAKESLYRKGELVLKPAEASFLKSIEKDMTLGRLVTNTKMTLTETFQLIYFLLLVDEIRLEGDRELGERSVRRQEDFISDRKNRRQRMRESAFESEMSGDNAGDFKEMVAGLFNKLGTLNHFELLGIPYDAGAIKIKEGYFRQVKTYHPVESYQDADDITKAKADGIFRALTESYETLIDKVSRTEYLESLGDLPEQTKREQAPEMPETLARGFAKKIAAKKTPPPSKAVEPEIPADDFDEMPDEEMDLDLGDVDETPQAPSSETLEEEPESALLTEGFKDDFDFGDDAEEAEPDLGVDSLDPEIDWGEDAFSDSDGDEDLDLDFSFDTPDNPEEEMRIQEGKQVTLDMAAVVKSELAFQQGEDALSDGDYEEAIELFAEAIKVNPNEAEYHAYLGWARFKSDSESVEAIQAAFKSIENGLAINPNLDTAYYFLGMIFRKQKNGEKAKMNLQKALQFNPQNDQARSALEQLEA